MELDLEIYSHLIKSGIIEGGLNNPNNKVFLESRKVLLDKENSILFENGMAFARYLIYVKRKMEAQKIGIKVNADMKSLLVAGDYGIINEYLRSLFNFDMQQTPGGEQKLMGSSSQVNIIVTNQKKNLEESFQQLSQGDGAIDISELQGSKRPTETVTCLEFLLVSISHAFQMSPKQAAGLLTNGNKYLNIAITKGLKGQFEPIQTLYQEVYANSKHLTALIEHENQYNLTQSTLSLMLNIFKTGFQSQAQNVILWCAKLYGKISFDFIEMGEIMGQAWDWFIDEQQGILELVVQAIKSNGELMDVLVPVIVNFSRYNFSEVFTHHIRKYLQIPADYLNLIHDLIDPLNEGKFSRDEMSNTGFLDYIIEQCILYGDTTSGAINSTKNDRQAAISLMTTIWSMYQDKFQKIIDNVDTSGTSKPKFFQHLKQQAGSEPQTLGQICLTVLKRNSRDKIQSVRLCAIAQLFRLLDQFSQERNQYAPILYKTLIFSMIENHQNELIRQHIMNSFQYLFDRVATIPVGILVEPLVKQIYMSEGVTYRFNVYDFDFFSSMARHARLNIKNAIQIVDIMAKAYLNEQALDFQTSASVPLMLIITRFLDHQAIQEFIVKFVSICITVLQQVEQEMVEKNVERRQRIIEFERQLEESKKKRVPKKKWPPEEDIASKLRPPEETSEEIELRTIQLIKRHRIIDIIKKLVKYRNQDLNDEIKIILLSGLQKFLEENKEESKGIVHLLSWWWGNPQKLLSEYILHQKKQEERNKGQDQQFNHDYSDNERQYHSQYDQRSEEPNKYIKKQQDQRQQNVNLSPTKDKSIMIKDVIKDNRSSNNQTNKINQQKPQQQAIPSQKNEFYNILEKAQKEEENKQKQQIKNSNLPPQQKRLQEPVRHKFQDIQQQYLNQNKSQQNNPAIRAQIIDSDTGRINIIDP